MLAGGLGYGIHEGVSSYGLHRILVGASPKRAAIAASKVAAVSGVAGAITGYAAHKASNLLSRKKSVDNKSVKELTAAAAKKQA